MPKKTTSIPVNAMANEFGNGISIEKISIKDFLSIGTITFEDFEEEARKSHRHDSHSFFLLESGTVTVEIDFKKYVITAPSIVYMHPDQVHRMLKIEDITVTSWAISNENLNAEYLKLLDEITPATPLALNPETFTIIAEAVSLSFKFFERKTEKLYHSLLKDSCNALVALVISQYLGQSNTTDKITRLEVVTKAFKDLLERDYTTNKRPSAYAEKLNISTAYLNECVKSATGYPVSYHIQQRVILEAKRLLSHSDTSVKEIATELGYDDYPYFSRLFNKITGMTALAFRNKNHD